MVEKKNKFSHLDFNNVFNNIKYSIWGFLNCF